MSSITLITSLVSGAYTLYCIHPFVPYKFLWSYIAMPTFNYMSSTQKKEIKNDIEYYEVISESKDPNTGIITRYLVLKKEEEFTIIEPIWL